MNTYEALYIMDNGLADETKESLIAKFNAVIADNGGTVDSCEKWGVKKLAYPIDFKTEGYYVLINFTAPATLPLELERVMRITDGLMRFLVIAK